MTDAPDYDPLAELLAVPVAAARALRVSERSVYRMITDGELAALKHGGKLWIEPDEITDYFARQRADAAKLRADRAKAARNRSRKRSDAKASAG